VVFQSNMTTFMSADVESIFVFQMMKGATDEQRKEWKMPCGQCFVWLPNSEKTVEGLYLLFHVYLSMFCLFLLYNILG